MPKQKKTDRKPKAGNLNLNAIVKDIIDRNGIATVNDIEKIMKRLDKLESIISSKKPQGKSAKTKGKKRKRGSTTGPVLEVIKKSKKGANTETIQAKTGLDKIKIRNAIFLLSKAGKIQRKTRGIYEAVKEQRQPAKPEIETKNDKGTTET